MPGDELQWWLQYFWGLVMKLPREACGVCRVTVTRCARQVGGDELCPRLTAVCVSGLSSAKDWHLHLGVVLGVVTGRHG